jgi:transposase
VAELGARTPELVRMAKWLRERNVKSSAMEITRVYWIAPHEVLEAEGLEVLLVDPQQLAQVPGRATRKPIRWMRGAESGDWPAGCK